MLPVFASLDEMLEGLSPIETPWPFFAFSREDLVCIVEEDDDLLDVFAAHGTDAEKVIDSFVAARGKGADQACGAAVMEALRGVFDNWLREVGYAGTDAAVPVVRPVRTGVMTADPQAGRYYQIGESLKLCFETTPTGAHFAGALGAPDVFLSAEDLQALPLAEVTFIKVGDL